MWDSLTSRRGACWDNTVVEGFFVTLKTDLIYRSEYATPLEARAEIFESIDGTAASGLDARPMLARNAPCGSNTWRTG